MLKQYKKILEANKREFNGHRFTLPSQDVYPHQWMWDSCFHAIIYNVLGDKDYAKDEIRAMLSGQWKNGMVPHMTYWNKDETYKQNWNTEGSTSSITQPPMMAYAVERIGDKEFTKEVFDQLDQHYKWLHNYRSKDSILYIIHPWESGEDDLLSWDTVHQIKFPTKDDLKKKKENILEAFLMNEWIFQARCVLFNSVYYKNLKCMERLAREVGSEEEKYYAELIPLVEESFRKYLWNERQEVYSSTWTDIYLSERVLDSSIFMSIFSGIPTKEEVQKMVKKYLFDKDKFWLKYPVPTVAADESDFEPERYWRGSTWININWFIWKGLEEYGLKREAGKIKSRTKKLVKKSGFCEYYHPVTGEGLGPQDFTWSGLVFDV